jgi:hypothetical protein
MSFWQWLGTFTMGDWIMVGFGIAALIFVNTFVPADPRLGLPPRPLDEDSLRRIMREELDRAKENP